MGTEALFLIPCDYCGKVHPYFGEEAIICTCGAIMAIQADFKRSRVVVRPITPREAKEQIEKDYEEKHSRDDQHGFA